MNFELEPTKGKTLKINRISTKDIGHVILKIGREQIELDKEATKLLREYLGATKVELQ